MAPLAKALSLLLFSSASAAKGIEVTRQEQIIGLNTENLDDDDPSKVHSALRNGHHRMLGKNKGESNKNNSNKGGTSGGGTNPVNDRAFTIPGIPVGIARADCTGQDVVLEEFTTHKLTQSKCGFLEKVRCTNPYTVSTAKKNDYRTSEECLQGTCGGCCREFADYLACDPTGTFIDGWTPCVCNGGTFGGNPFVGSGGIDIAPGGAPTDGGEGGGGSQFIYQGQYPGCSQDFWGRGHGVAPLERPANLPAELNPGECTETSHCAGTYACCWKGYCLCGAPDETGSNCRP